MRRLKIFGDSHVLTLDEGSKLVEDSFATRNLRAEFYTRHGVNWSEFETTEKNGKLHFYADRVAGYKPVDYSVESLEDIYVFSSPLHSAPTARDSAWKNFCPWQCFAANPDLQALSTSVTEAWIQQLMNCRFLMLRTIKERGYKIAVVEPPKLLTRMVSRFGLRQDVLLAVDRIHRDLITRWLAENGIPLISVPDETHSEGFTRDDYSSLKPRDPHHGNAQFGAAMLAKIVEFASNV